MERCKSNPVRPDHVYNPSHFFGFFSTFNPDAIKDVRLYKGGYPPEYGGRLGSVLSIYNKDGNRNQTQATVTLGMLASRAAIEGPISKGSYMFAMRRSTLEPLLGALRASIDNIPSLFYFLDTNGKLSVNIGANDKLSMAFYSGKDRVDFPFGDDAEFKLNYGNQTISGNWTHIFNEMTFSNFVLTGSRYFNFPNFEIAGTPFKRDNNIYDLSLKADIEYLPNEKHSASTGIWAGVFTFRIQDQFDGQIPSTKLCSMPPGTYKTNGALLSNGNSLADCASIPFLIVHISDRTPHIC